MPLRGGETAKRQNGRAGAPPAKKGRGRAREREQDFPARRCAARKQGARAVGREDRISRRSGAPPVHKGARLPGERRYSHAVLRRYFHAYFAAVFSCLFCGGIFMPF